MFETLNFPVIRVTRNRWDNETTAPTARKE